MHTTAKTQQHVVGNENQQPSYPTHKSQNTYTKTRHSPRKSATVLYKIQNKIQKDVEYSQNQEIYCFKFGAPLILAPVGFGPFIPFTRPRKEPTYRYIR